MRKASLIAAALGGAALLVFVLLSTLAPPPGEAPPASPERGAEEAPPAPAPGEPAATPADPGTPPAAPESPVGTGAVAGVVREKGSGAPVAGAGVRLVVAGKRRAATAGPDGAYRFDDVPPGGGQVTAWSARHADSAPAAVTVPAAGEVRADLELGPGAVVAGTVRDRDSGLAIPGARVGVAMDDHRMTTAGPDGRYRLEGLSTGNVFLDAEGDDYPALRRMVAVATADTEMAQDFDLVRGATVSGAVVDGREAPIAGAEVWAPGQEARKATTGEDGAFTLRAVPTDRGVILFAKREGYAQAGSEPLSLKPGEDVTGFRFVLALGAHVRGSVLFTDGRPAAGAQVFATAQSGGRGVYMAPQARTDATGAFDLFPVPPGDYLLTVRHTGALPAQREVKGVEEGAVLAGVEIRLSAGERIRGVVRTAAGGPAAGLTVTAQPKDPGTTVGSATTWGQGRSDPEGKFDLEGLTPGAYLVTAHGARGGARVSADAQTGAEDVVLVLPATGAVAGKVVLPSGLPVTSCFVRLEQEGGAPGGIMLHERVSAADGSFRIGDLAAGAYTLTAQGEGAFSEPLRGVEVVGDGVTGEIVLTLLPGATVRGRVLDGEDQPMSGVRVMATPAKPGIPAGIAQTTSGTGGEFELVGLAPGAWRLAAGEGQRWTSSGEFEAAAGAEIRQDVKFPRLATLSVRVTDAAGRPLAGALVQVTDASGRWVGLPVPRVPADVPPDKRNEWMARTHERMMRTGNDGVCVREGVPEGNVRVQVILSGYKDGDAAVEVPGGGQAEAHVALEVGAGSADGKQDPDGVTPPRPAPPVVPPRTR